jgi:hypothetical protein
MQKAFLLCNNKHRQIVRSEKPLEKVRLLSFEYKETDSNDLSPFTFEWYLPKSKQTVCQHYNMSYKTMSQTISDSPNHDVLKRMKTFYGANEDFYEFTIKLNRSFRSENSSVMITIDILD